jgi:hypothetical protein
MISFIISLIPLLFIVYYLIVLKRSSVSIYIKSLSAKKNGSICYNCSSDIDPSIKTNWFSGKATLCISCERDRSVKTLINPFKSKLYKFDKYFFNEKFEKYQMILLIISMSFIFTNIILSSFFDTKIGSIPSNILLGFYWFMMIYRVRVSLRGYLKREDVVVK